MRIPQAQPVPRVPRSSRDDRYQAGHPAPGKRAGAGAVVSVQTDTVTVDMFGEELTGVIPIGPIPSVGSVVEVEARGDLLVIPVLFGPPVEDWVTHDLSTFIDDFDDYSGDGGSAAAYSGGSLHAVTLQPSSGTWSFALPSIVLPATGMFTFEVTQEAAAEPTGWAAYAAKALPPALDDWGVEVAQQAAPGGIPALVTTDSRDMSTVSDLYPHVVWNANVNARFTQIRTLETP